MRLRLSEESGQRRSLLQNTFVVSATVTGTILVIQKIKSFLCRLLLTDTKNNYWYQLFMSADTKNQFSLLKKLKPRSRPVRPRSELAAGLCGAGVQYERHLRGGPPPAATTMC
jgi:hypothetical protein